MNQDVHGSGLHEPKNENSTANILQALESATKGFKQNNHGTPGSIMKVMEIQSSAKDLPLGFCFETQVNNRC